jgi:hypothetical protein
MNFPKNFSTLPNIKDDRFSELLAGRVLPLKPAFQRFEILVSKNKVQLIRAKISRLDNLSSKCGLKPFDTVLANHHSFGVLKFA